jgi:hypothetical protein
LMRWNRYLLWFLNFTDNKDGVDRMEENCNRLWYIQDIFEIMNRAFFQILHPFRKSGSWWSECVFRETMIFRQYIPKKHEHFGIKMYRLCDSAGYTYDMKVYLGKDGQCTSQHLTATPVTNWQGRQKNVAKNCTWTISFPSLNFLIKWQN